MRLPAGSGILCPGRWQAGRAAFWLACLLLVLAPIFSLQSILRKVTASPSLLLATAFLTLFLSYLAYALMVRRCERRFVSELAPAQLPGELAGGVVLGMALMTAIIIILCVSGGYRLSPGNWTDWPHDIREALGTGLLEELLARLILFRLLSRALGAVPGLALSALLFGSAHLANPGATSFSAAAIAIEAGLMLAGLFLLTGRIWLSAGVHAGWNFAQGAIFGTPVSGMLGEGSALRAVPVAGAPIWWTGGTFGPEGSLVAILVGLGAFVATLALVRRRAALSA